MEYAAATWFTEKLQSRSSPCPLINERKRRRRMIYPKGEQGVTKVLTRSHDGSRRLVL